VARVVLILTRGSMNCLKDVKVLRLWGCKMCGRKCISLCHPETIPTTCFDAIVQHNKAEWKMIEVLERPKKENELTKLDRW